MLDKNQIAAASRILQDHWRAGTKLASLDASQRPRDRAEGYAIQAAIEQYSAGILFGWKIAATSEAGQKHINVDGPMAGRILPETVIPDGGTASMAGNEMRVAEPEFAFRMATDLPPRSSAYTVGEVLDAVGTLHPAIEIPIRGSRISSALEPHKSSRTMHARTCSCSVRQRRRTGARSISLRRNPSLRCRPSNSSVMERTCLATPGLP
jgi:2-keto-4-pentenoate hydratase